MLPQAMLEALMRRHEIETGREATKETAVKEELKETAKQTQTEPKEELKVPKEEPKEELKVPKVEKKETAKRTLNEPKEELKVVKKPKQLKEEEELKEELKELKEEEEQKQDAGQLPVPCWQRHHSFLPVVQKYGFFYCIGMANAGRNPDGSSFEDDSQDEEEPKKEEEEELKKHEEELKKHAEREKSTENVKAELRDDPVTATQDPYECVRL